MSTVDTVVNQSVIIPTSGDVLRLEWTLAGLMRQESDTIAEVIVVADCTADALPAVEELVARYEGFTLVSLPVKEEPTLFRAGSARNLGVTHARGEQLVFLDEDCCPDSDWLAAHWEHRGKMAIGLRRDLHQTNVFPYEGVIDDTYIRMYSAFDPRYHNEVPLPGDWATSNASAPREALMAVGGFDTEFDGQWGGEDLNLSCRLRDYGLSFEMLREVGWVTHFAHPRREKRPDNMERFHKALRGEYPVIANGGPLVPAA